MCSQQEDEDEEEEIDQSNSDDSNSDYNDDDQDGMLTLWLAYLHQPLTPFFNQKNPCFARKSWYDVKIPDQHDRTNFFLCQILITHPLLIGDL